MLYVNLIYADIFVLSLSLKGFISYPWCKRITLSVWRIHAFIDLLIDCLMLLTGIRLSCYSVPNKAKVTGPATSLCRLFKLHSLSTKYPTAIYRRGLQICLHVPSPVVHGWVEEQVKSVIHQMDELRTSPCSSQVSLLFLCEILHATNLEVEILGDEENYGILNMRKIMAF